MPEAVYGEIFRRLHGADWEYLNQQGQSAWAKLKAVLADGRHFEVNFAADATTCRFDLPVVRIAVNRACVRGLCAFLTVLNQELRVGSFSLTPNGYVYLSATLPPSCASLEVFRGMLAGLRAYFSNYHEEIELMATQPAVADSYLLVMDDSLGEPVELGVSESRPAAVDPAVAAGRPR